MPPTTSAEFDHAYRLPFTVWGDVRMPPEIVALAEASSPRTSLELGCGIGRFTEHLARQGIRATGVDFSAVAIDKARARTEAANLPARFVVGDVTHLDDLEGPFDISFDVGCFHCLDEDQQRGYVRQISRLLAPGGTHLIWSLDSPPSDLIMTAARMKQVFGPGFTLVREEESRRRLVASHWFWLRRLAG